MNFKRLTYSRVLRMLGLPFRTNPDTALATWKKRHIEARRAGNELDEKFLSQCREIIRRRMRNLPHKCSYDGCDAIVSNDSTNCRMHVFRRLAFREFCVKKLNVGSIAGFA